VCQDTELIVSRQGFFRSYLTVTWGDGLGRISSSTHK